jgi:two-component system response regulator ResD
MSELRSRILIVDDTEDLLTVLQYALQRARYTVDASLDPSEGLSLQASRRYDLILCDLQMPGIDGIEFCTRVMGEHPEMKGRLVLMTGGEGLDRAEGLLRSGAVRTLDKPFALKELYRFVREIIDSPSPAPSGDEAA